MDNKVLWVAELGSMHRGSKELAHRMIYEAALASADVAKFQLGWPERDSEIHWAAPTQRNIRYIDDWVEDLDRWCSEYGIEFMASIWSEAGLEAARSVNMKRYKIAHQMRNMGLINKIRDLGKEVFLSREHMVFGTLGERMILTTDKYPTDFRDVHMPTVYTHWYGYSDHTIGNEMCWLAVSRGAQYIEKHFTLDPTNLDIRDNSFSAPPAEFKELVDVGNRIARIA